MIHFSACCVFILVSTAEAKPNKKTKTGGKPNNVAKQPKQAITTGVFISFSFVVVFLYFVVCCFCLDSVAGFPAALIQQCLG